MLTKKDEIYVISQPKKLVLSLIVVDSNLESELKEKVHNSLGWLKDYSDIFFIFSEKHRPGQRMVDKIKFTSLYNGCGFIESSSERLGHSIFKALRYDKEIFSEDRIHHGFTISLLSELENIKVLDIKKIVENIIPNNISWPIYKERRLDSKELYNIYKLRNPLLDEPTSQNKAGQIIKSIFSILVNALKRRKFKGETDGVCMYSTWHSLSPMIYIPNACMKIILDHTEDEDFYNWLDTFNREDPRYIFASLINYLGLEIFDNEIENIDIKINYGNDSKGKK